ncbi:MAG: hypothetical protein EOM55_01250 [Clostridia bacterium]|nr:hypothetical protein [Clostridia bacterium]
MEMMNFEVKSLLAIYNLIPQVAESIDKLVRTRASCSCVQEVENGVERQMESIIKLTMQKVNLINLKILADETLCEMPPRLSKLVIARCIDKMDINFLASTLGISVRDTYRKIKNALQEFKRVFLKIVLKNKKVWDKIVKNFFWFDVLEKINKFEDEGGGVSICPKFVCKMILQKLRKIV